MIGAPRDARHAHPCRRASLRTSIASATTQGRAYDALYFYNPFHENVFLPWEQLDHNVELHAHRFARDVHAAERMLKLMPVGSLLLTYYQFGGRIPLGYSLLRAARHEENVLRLWRKQSADLAHGYWREEGARVLRHGRTAFV